MIMAAKKTSYELRVVKVGGVCEPLTDDPSKKVTRPEDVLMWFEPFKSSPQEHFVCLSLNGAGQVMNTRVITIGLLNHSLVHPREVFRGAILDSAASIIVCHNHPSGSLEPSSQDIAITAQLKEAGAIVGIPLIDHVIVTRAGHLSMRERGLLWGGRHESKREDDPEYG